MNWIPGLCLLGGIGIALPFAVAFERWRNRRETNVVDLDVERAQRRHPSNVRPLVRNEGVKVLPYRRWPA